MIDKLNIICMWLSDVIIFVTSIAMLAFGLKNFFKKGVGLYARLITLGVGSYAMGTMYHFCQTLTSDDVVEGFTYTYLGKIGFFLFLFTANYGQMSKLLDDGSDLFKKSRRLAIIAPVVAATLYIPCLVLEMPISTKISFGLIWLSSLPTLYFNLKHAIINDCGFGFAKAIRPFNAYATALVFIELIQMIMWCYYEIDGGFIIIAAISVIFSIMLVITMIHLKKGVKAWTI